MKNLKKKKEVGEGMPGCGQREASTEVTITWGLNEVTFLNTAL